MKNVAVYCGSSPGRNGIYRDEAARLGRLMAEKGIRIIFGGGQVGLMGALADAALGAGGKVVGIIPRFLHVKEVAHHGLSELITVESMHERKALIHDMSEAFVALPGGFGTLDELFEMLTWGQLGIHRKAVGILNIHGFFDPVIAAMDRMVQEGFLKRENREVVLTEACPAELLTRLSGYVPPESVPKWI